MAVKFHGNKVPKESFQCICRSAVVIDSVYEMNINYNTQSTFQEIKYKVKES